MARTSQTVPLELIKTDLLALPPVTASKVTKPSAGTLVLFVDKADNILKAKKSDGSIVQIKNKIFQFELNKEVLAITGIGSDPAK